MNPNKWFKQVLIGASVVTVMSLILAGYSFKNALDAEPKLKNDFSIFDDQPSWFDFNQSFENPERFPTDDQWIFNGNHKEVSIKTFSANLKIVESDLNQITVRASGLLNKDLALRILEINETDGSIEVLQPENNAVSDLSVIVELPKDRLEKLSAFGVSGDMQLNRVTAKSIDVKTISGNVKVQGSQFQTIEIKSVSGEVTLALNPKASYQFKLKTISGEIKNTQKPSSQGKNQVIVNTVSGNIKVN